MKRLKGLKNCFLCALVSVLFAGCTNRVREMKLELPNGTVIEMVDVDGRFSIGKYEVTQAQYEAVMGNNPSAFKGASLPVECVSWHDAIAFCKKN